MARAASDTPFTRALIDNITQPGVEIQQAMTKVRAEVNEQTNKGQLPWGRANLIGSVYLNPAPAPTAAAPAATAAPALASTSGNTDVNWSSGARSRTTNKPEELNAYLSSYPNRPVQVAGAGPDRFAG